MIEVTYNAGTEDHPKWGVYRFVNDDNNRYWLGVRPLEGAHFTPNCTCPTRLWSGLMKAAVEQGADPESFRTKKETKKVSSRGPRKAKKNPGISIF